MKIIGYAGVGKTTYIRNFIINNYPDYNEIHIFTREHEPIYNILCKTRDSIYMHNNMNEIEELYDELTNNNKKILIVFDEMKNDRNKYKIINDKLSLFRTRDNIHIIITTFKENDIPKLARELFAETIYLNK